MIEMKKCGGTYWKAFDGSFQTVHDGRAFGLVVSFRHSYSFGDRLCLKQLYSLWMRRWHMLEDHWEGVRRILRFKEGTHIPRAGYIAVSAARVQ